MIEKIITTIKKVATFCLVWAASFIAIFVIGGMTGVLEREDAPILFIVAWLFVPFILAFLTVKKKFPKTVRDAPTAKPESAVQEALQVFARSSEEKAQQSVAKRAELEQKIAKLRTKNTAKKESNVDPYANAATTYSNMDQPYLPKVGNTHRVTGLKYRKEDVLKLARENPSYKLTKDQIIKQGLTDTHIHKYLFTNSPVTLEQEPTNPYDPKAIKVIVAGQHIGYIKAGSCAHLNKVINEGRIEQVLCRIYGGPSITVYCDIDEDTGKRVWAMEKDDIPLCAELRIVEKAAK